MTYLNKLDLELAKLQQISKTKKHFKVEWIPQEQSPIEGKVDGDTITIYSENMEDALDTLRHEFIDYLVSQVIKPHVEIINVLLFVLSQDGYDKKEDIVEKLVQLYKS